MLSNMPFTVTAAVCVIVAVLAITVVFCTALIRALPALMYRASWNRSVSFSPLSSRC